MLGMHNLRPSDPESLILLDQCRPSDVIEFKNVWPLETQSPVPPACIAIIPDVSMPNWTALMSRTDRHSSVSRDSHIRSTNQDVPRQVSISRRDGYFESPPSPKRDDRFLSQRASCPWLTCGKL